MNNETKPPGFMIGILISALVVIAANSRSGYASEQQQIQSHASAPRVISFSGGRVVVERQDDVDHVTVLDIDGTLQSESWCPLESGSYDELSTFFKRFVTAIEVGDTDTVVSLVRYPFRVNRVANIRISDRAGLLRRYAEVFNTAVIKGVRSAAPEAIFCRNGAAMISDGIVWAHAERGRVALDVLNK